MEKEFSRKDLGILNYFLEKNDYYNFFSLFCVLYKTKDVCVLWLDFQEAEKITKGFDGGKIFVSMGRKRYFLSKDGYDNKISYNPKGNKVYLSVSFDEEISKTAARLFDEENIIEIGKILGYPDCCIREYSKLINPKQKGWKGESEKLLKTCSNSGPGPFPFYNNFTEFDALLIHHFPCKWNCKKSMEIGKRNYEILKKNYPGVAGHFFSELRKPVFISKKFIIQFNWDGTYNFRGEIPECESFRVLENRVELKNGGNLAKTVPGYLVKFV